MKKLIASLAGAALLVPAMSTSAAAYPVSQETNVKFTGAPKNVKKGKKVRIVAKLNASDASVCTGDFVLVVRKGATVLKQSRKPASSGQASFGFKMKKLGRNVVKVKYQRGENDPCGKSNRTKKVFVKR